MSDVDITSLLNDAVQEGGLDNNSLQFINNTFDDIGSRIQAGLGTAADSITSSETVLVSVCVDDSGSMAGSKGQAAIDGTNAVVSALMDSKQKSNILFSSRLLNGRIICPFNPLEQSVSLTQNNYVPRGMTPLYDETLVMMATIAAKVQDCAANGIPVRSVSLIVTDGANTSGRSSISRVEQIIKGMLQQENHIVAAMGIGANQTEKNTFRTIFEQMGIPTNWILTPDNSPTEIRRAFAVFSNSAVRASQNAASFSKTLAGGFSS
ncbi:MAG TPA: vWA domain-containing protein [Methylomirabilota bacterium]|nr:vWA domain-containing protein [Methylomirabilota bacterium]